VHIVRFVNGQRINRAEVVRKRSLGKRNHLDKKGPAGLPLPAIATRASQAESRNGLVPGGLPTASHSRV
jgi:hypothetical protein